MDREQKLPLYVLAGGKSSRFGQDKALVPVDGAPMMLRAAEAVYPAAVYVTAVADVAGKYDGLGFPTIADPVPDLGPIGGLLAALADQRAVRGPGWILLAPCDLVSFREEWLDALVAKTSGTYDAVAFRGENWEPLPALYHTRIERAAKDQVKAGVLGLWRLLDRATACAVPEPADWREFRQVNTRGDLLAWNLRDEREEDRP